jgi:hypothetical protein
MYFNVCFSAMALLFVGAVGVVLLFIESPQRIAAVFGAVGVSVTGLVAQMTRMWRQKVSADMLLALCGVLGEDQLTAVITDLLKRM